MRRALIAAAVSEAAPSRGEEIDFGLMGEIEQPIFRCLGWLDRAAAENVGDALAPFGETWADGKAAMAGQQLVFAAHKRRPRPGRHLFDLLGAFGEPRTGRHTIVIADAAARGTSTESGPRNT